MNTQSACYAIITSHYLYCKHTVLQTATILALLLSPFNEILLQLLAINIQAYYIIVFFFFLS